jgi:hypothetical protein
MKKIACSLAFSVGVLLSTAVAANAAVYDWNFAGAGLSGSGTLTAVDEGGGIFDITGGAGTVTDATYGPFAVTFATCAYGSTCTLTNTDGGGANLSYDNLLFPGNSIGSQLDGNGIVLLPGPPGSGSTALGIWDGPSQSFYKYTDVGYENLTTPFNVLAAAAPEPSTWAMMILGFFGMGFMAYRRKQDGSAFRIA